MMRYRVWSAWSMIVAPLLPVSVACGAQPPDGGATSVPPTAAGSSAVPRAAVGTAIDDYLAQGSVKIAEHPGGFGQPGGELLAERYYHSDAVACAEIHSATKSVMSTLVGIALTKGASPA